MFPKRRPLICFGPDDESGAAAPVTEAPVSANDPVPPAAEPEEIDLESELEERSYSKAEIQAVRQEAAKRRTQLREKEERLAALYDGIEDPTDLDYLAGITRKLYSDNPREALTEFEGMIQRLRDALGDDAPASPEGEPDDAEKPLTRADLERLERERAVAAATRQLQSEATSLGYKDGTPEYAQLIWIANNDKAAAGDLQKAHAIILGRLDEVGKAAIAAHAEAVKAANAEFPPVTAPGGGAPAGSPTAGPPKTFKSASESALARLNAAQ